MRMMNQDGTLNMLKRTQWRWSAPDLYHRLLAMGWGPFLFWVSLFYAMVNVVFATGFWLIGPQALEGGEGHGWWDAFFFSVQTLATIGYGRMIPHGWLANSLVAVEAFFGFLILALVTGVVYARFARPTARVVFSRKALLSDHDGVRSLMFRVANERHNRILEAHIHLALVLNEDTVEGESYRVFHDLKLERSRTPLFAMSWTVVHPITESSPFFGRSLDDLRQLEAEVFVSFNGVDDTFSQSVHKTFSYAMEDIVENHRFEDMFLPSRKHPGRYEMDSRRIHDTSEMGSSGAP